MPGRSVRKPPENKRTTSPGERRGVRHDVTILDIAKYLDISHTTVSRAIAGHEHISEETKKRVKQAAKRMGYVPNASARTMRGQRSSVVGLIIPDVQNDFYATVAKIVADNLAAHAMQLMLSVTEDDPDRELRELRALTEARPSGVIIVPTVAPHAQTIAMLRDLKSVELVRTHPKIATTAVIIDDRAGTYAAARHLVAAGHRRIAYIGGATELSTGRDRLAGFQAALSEAGLSSSNIALGPPRPDFARTSISVTMASPASSRPTALVLGSAELTLGALQGLRSANIEWPRDISVVGYHDPAWFELIGSGITTVRLPVQDVAQTASRVLLSQLGEGGPRPAREHTVIRLNPALMLRGSTASLAEAAPGFASNKILFNQRTPTEQ
jgi:LacI family transcriptional regulator